MLVAIPKKQHSTDDQHNLTLDMAQRTYVEEMAAFTTKAGYGDLSEEARTQLKLRVLDTIGCAIAALRGEPVLDIRQQVVEFGGRGRRTLIGMGETSLPDRAAFYNGALVRYVWK